MSVSDILFSWMQTTYRQNFNISHTKSQNINVSHLILQFFAQSIEARY